MLVSAVRPILGWWGASWNALVVYYETFAVVGLSLAMGLAALCRWRLVFVAGCLLAALAYVYLPIPSLMNFSTQGTGESIRFSSRSWTIEVTLSCVVAFFVFCIPFRLRGWRIKACSRA
jgi:hypothetical protein